MKNIEATFHQSIAGDTKGLYLIPSINIFWSDGYFQLEIGWLFWAVEIIRDKSIF